VYAGNYASTYANTYASTYAHTYAHNYNYADNYGDDDDSLLYGDLNMNAWEHVDDAIQGDARGLGAFMREFISKYTCVRVEKLSFGEDMTFTQDALQECLRALNYAKDDEETEDALLDLYATSTYC